MQRTYIQAPQRNEDINFAKGSKGSTLQMKIRGPRHGLEMCAVSLMVAPACQTLALDQPMLCYLCIYLCTDVYQQKQSKIYLLGQRRGTGSSTNKQW
jgi:hypothetical protein